MKTVYAVGVDVDPNKRGKDWLESFRKQKVFPAFDLTVKTAPKNAPDVIQKIPR